MVAITALAGLATAEPGLLRPAGRLAAEHLTTARIVGLVVAVLGIVALWHQRRSLSLRARRRDPDLGGVLLRAGLILAAFALLLRLGPPLGGTDEDGGDTPAGGGTPGEQVNADAPPLDIPRPPPETAPITDGFGEVGSILVPDDRPPPEAASPPAERDPFTLDLSFLRSLGGILILIILLGVVVMVFRLLRRGISSSGGDDDEDDELPADEDDHGAIEAEAGLVASLSEVRRDRNDPRSQIAAAYLRLLAALAAAGFQREPQEAPHEHLHRALGPLGVRPRPLHRLAALYVAAEFSEHAVTDEHRAEAARALEESLSDLRARADGVAAGVDA